MKLNRPIFNKLNSLGVSHLVVPIVVVLVIGAIGTYLVGIDHAQTPSPKGLNVSAAIDMARKYDNNGINIGFAVVSNGSSVATYHEDTPNSGGSVTKVLLLAAYLNQVGNGTLSDTAKSKLTAMIEDSDNSSANWVYNQLTKPKASIDQAAAGNGFKLVVHPGHPYIIGESTVTADCLASFFANTQYQFPAKHQSFALNLLSHISEKVGLLQAGLPGTVYSKEGWTDLDAGYPGYPYIVNQAAQFNVGSRIYGVAVTVGGLNEGSYASDQTHGEAIVKNIVDALVR